MCRGGVLRRAGVLRRTGVLRRAGAAGSEADCAADNETDSVEWKKQEGSCRSDTDIRTGL